MLLKHKTANKPLRFCVKQFITQSEHPNVARFKAYYEETEGKMNGETWNQYWKRMTENKVWVDSWFVQATAWYLQLDLWIVDCANRDDHPFIRISGNLGNADVPCSGAIITIGTKSSCHYQSLLPIEMLHMSNQQQPESSANQPKKMSQKADSKYVEARQLEEKTKDLVHDNKPSQSSKMKETPDEVHNNIKENSPEMMNRNSRHHQETKMTETLNVPEKTSHR